MIATCNQIYVFMSIRAWLGICKGEKERLLQICAEPNKNEMTSAAHLLEGLCHKNEFHLMS